MRVLLAFLARDARIRLSYRLEAAIYALSVLLHAGTFYFVARMLGKAAVPALADYGGDYYPFVLVGIAFSAYQAAGLRAFTRSLREEQCLGTLEQVLASPARIPVLLLAWAQWDFLYATAEVLLYLLLGAGLFGLSFGRCNPSAAFCVLLPALAAFMGLGLLSAAFVMRFKRGDPVAWLLGAASELLGGVYFPVILLPPWLKAFSSALPMTHALEGLRRSLLQGVPLSGVLPQALALSAFAALSVPLGLFCFQKSLNAARSDGSLGHY